MRWLPILISLTRHAGSGVDLTMLLAFRHFSEKCSHSSAIKIRSQQQSSALIRAETGAAGECFPELSQPLRPSLPVSTCGPATDRRIPSCYGSPAGRGDSGWPRKLARRSRHCEAGTGSRDFSRVIQIGADDDRNSTCHRLENAETKILRIRWQGIHIGVRESF